jgi:hypothetical protein
MVSFLSGWRRWLWFVESGLHFFPQQPLPLLDIEERL